MARSTTARIAAPAAFLAAVTVAAFAVRAGLEREPPPAPPAPPPRVETRTTAPEPERRFYEVRSGDTLAAIADRFDTTVEELLRLNPDVDPVALRVGQRIRVE